MLKAAISKSAMQVRKSRKSLLRRINVSRRSSKSNIHKITRIISIAGVYPLIKKALDNITPQVEVKSRRVGGATFQVPTEIRPDRKESISMKNLIQYARKRGGKTMAEKLAAEIVDAFNEQGGAFKRKEDMHKMAEANRAFAHFRF